MTSSPNQLVRVLSRKDEQQMAREAAAMQKDISDFEVDEPTAARKFFPRREMTSRPSLPPPAFRKTQQPLALRTSEPLKTSLNIATQLPGTKPWKTPEIEERLRNVSKAVFNEDLEEAVQEMEVISQQTPYTAWSVMARLELVQNRRSLNSFIEKIYRQKAGLICKCNVCANDGPNLYRGAICQTMAVQSIVDRQLAFNYEHQSAFAYRWRGDKDRDAISRLWDQYKGGRGTPELASLIAVLLLEFVTEYCPNFLSRIDVIVSVPPDPIRNEQRGFDPVGEVFKIFASLTCIPMVDGLLKKDRGDSLRRMNDQQRAAATRNMYSFVGKYDLRHLNVLLVDDVITTGNTIKNCGRLLKNQGEATEIKVLSLFQAESSRKADQFAEEMECDNRNDDLDPSIFGWNNSVDHDFEDQPEW